jgi:hypothetical protein
MWVQLFALLCRVMLRLWLVGCLIYT